jgi:hypothetical protein
LSTISREPNQFEGVFFVPGREEYAVTIRDPEGKRMRTIAWKRNLEHAVAFRNIFIEQRNRERLNAATPETTATKGEHE